MDKRLALSIAAPLTAASLACAWVLLKPGKPVALPLSVVEQCQRAAELLYDISWAAACLKTPDDSVDCTLPDAQAAKVNAILSTEEARCEGSYTPP